MSAANKELSRRFTELFSTGDEPRIDRETVTLPAETAVVLTT